MRSVTSLRYIPVELLALTVLLATIAAVAAAVPALLRRDVYGAAITAARVLLGGAVLAVLAVTLVGGAGGTGVNLAPGAGIRAGFDNVNGELGLVNVLGNVAMFVPVGFLVPLATSLRFLGGVAACGILSVAVEVLQLAAGRSLDIDDVLLNTSGGAVGAAVGITLEVLLQRRRSSG